MEKNKTLKIIKYIFILLVFLLITRFLDMCILWNLAREEYKYIATHYPAFIKAKEDPYIIFLGNSRYEKALELLMSEIKTKRHESYAISYFDFAHPFVFIVYNKIDSKTIPMPWLGQVEVSKGFNEIYVYKFDLVRIIRESYRLEIIIIPILGSLPTYKLITMPPRSYGNNKGGFKFYIEIPEFYLNYSRYLKNIYTFYFYFPLVLILLFSLLYTKKIFFSFLYFIEMLLLFHPGLFLSSIFLPFRYFLSKIFGGVAFIEILQVIAIISVGIIYCLFLKFIFSGSKMIKNQGLDLKEKFIILYFLILPIIFRF